MNTANLTNKATVLSRPHQLVDDRTKSIIIDVLFMAAGSCISSFGIVTNVINIVVYMKQGIKDSITVQFISLSVSDCSFSVLVLASSVCAVIGQVSPNMTVVDPISLSYCLAQAREKVYSMSVMTIFMMSVERCFCVAFPFTVKLVFTKSRSIKAVVCMAILFVTLMIPEYLNQGLAWGYDPRFKAIRLLFWFSSGNSGFEIFKNSILSGLIPVMTGVTATVCALYIISAVKSSFKFRQVAAAGKPQGSFAKEAGVSNGVASTAAKTRLSGRDVRSAKTVVAVDIVFAICNIPKCIVLASNIVSLYIPEFSLLVPGIYQNLIFVIMSITYTLEAVNSACTFLVYYAFSTKFRAALLTTFCSHLNASNRDIR